MSIKTQLACFFDIHESETIAPSELIGHLRNGTISRKGNVVFDKDHKYVVLRHKENGAILYFMVYDYSDTDFGFLAEYARSLCTYGKAPTDTEDADFNVLASINNCELGKSQYDFIGHGAFTLTKGMDLKLVLFYQRGYRDEARTHYLDALRDEARQELADLFGVAVQIQFDLRAVSMPRGQECTSTT